MVIHKLLRLTLPRANVNVLIPVTGLDGKKQLADTA